MVDDGGTERDASMAGAWRRTAAQLLTTSTVTFTGSPAIATHSLSPLKSAPQISRLKHTALDRRHLDLG